MLKISAAGNTDSRYSRNRQAVLRVLVLLLCATGCLSHAGAQTSPGTSENLLETLSLRGIREELRARDLTPAWLVLRTDPTVYELQIRQALTGGEAVQQFPTLAYSRGDVITLGDQSYLVAYRAEVERDPQIVRRLQRRAQRRLQRGEGLDTRLEENAVLVLSLLNLQVAGHLMDIRAFDPTREILTEAEQLKNKVRDVREESQMNLKQIALATLQYVQDYDEMLPPMRAAQSAGQIRSLAQTANSHTDKSTPVQLMLLPYARSIDIFIHPETGRPYLPNWRISRQNYAEDVAFPAQTILFYEDAPDEEGLRNVAFVDGHIEAVDDEKWQRIATANKLPP